MINAPSKTVFRFRETIEPELEKRQLTLRASPLILRAIEPRLISRVSWTPSTPRRAPLGVGFGLMVDVLHH